MPVTLGEEMMCGRNISARLSALFTILFLCVSLPTSLAAEVIGQIDNIDPVRGVVSIDGFAYQVGQGSGNARGIAAQLKNLKKGQVVRYQTKDGKLTELVVLPGLTEIPR